MDLDVSEKSIIRDYLLTKKELVYDGFKKYFNVPQEKRIIWSIFNRIPESKIVIGKFCCERNLSIEIVGTSFTKADINARTKIFLNGSRNVDTRTPYTYYTYVLRPKLIQSYNWSKAASYLYTSILSSL